MDVDIVVASCDVEVGIVLGGGLFLAFPIGAFVMLAVIMV